MELNSELSTPKAPKAANASPSKEDILDSWEDDALSDSSLEDKLQQIQEEKKGEIATASDTQPLTVPRAPPPTPVSPRTLTPDWDNQGSSGFREERRRPEKSTAVAGRLIAGALGVKAPKKTDEQRAYERSVKEQEIKRRNREKEQREKEKLEDERQKASVWDG